MAWTSGVAQSALHIVTTTEWNNGQDNFDFLCDGDYIQSELVRESSMDIENGPVNGDMLMAESSTTGGMQWAGAHMIHSIVGEVF